MTEREIGSVVMSEDKAKKDLETFAVCFDFLSRVDRGFVRSQKIILMVSIALLVTGLLLFTLSTMSTIDPSPFYFLPIIAGAALLPLVMVRRPRSIRQLQKVHWALAAVHVPAGDVNGLAVIDTTGKVWQDDFELLTMHREELSPLIDDLPVALSRYEDEVDTLRSLRDITDLSFSTTLSEPVGPAGFLDDLVTLSERTGGRPNSTMQGMSWDQAKLLGLQLSDMREACQSQTEFAERCIENVNRKVTTYLEMLEILHKDETDRMGIKMAQFMEEIEHVTDVFDPLIRTFQDDALDGLAMVERFSQRELDLIEDRLIQDQRYIDLLLTSTVLQAKAEMERIKHDGHLRESRLSTVQDLIATLESVRQETLQPLAPSLAETMRQARPAQDEVLDLPQMLLDATQEATGMGVFLENLKHREVAPDVLGFIPPIWSGMTTGQKVQPDGKVPTGTGRIMADPLTESQMRRYDAMTLRTNRRFVEVRKKIVVCTTELGTVVKDLVERVEQDLKHAEAQFIAGRRSIAAADVSKEQDYKRVRRDVNRLEDQQEFIARALIEAQLMLVEETVRHVRPFAERGRSFETERVRLETDFRSVMGSCARCDRRIMDRLTHGKEDAMFYIPYWIVRSESKGRSFEKVYSLSNLDEKGALRPRFKELDLDLEKLRAMMGPEQKVDLGLIADVRASRKVFLKQTDVPLLDSLIVAWGVRRLGKVEG
jgi:hypothetical protein